MKVLWYDPDNADIVAYDSTEHGLFAHKFLFWGGAENGTLLVGSLSAEISSHNDLLIQTRTDKPRGTPSAAGNCAFGQIKSWKSDGLAVITPTSLRPIIQKALNLKLSADLLETSA